MKYARYSDLATAGTALVETGTAATGYPATKVMDLNPADPAKLNEVSGAIVRDLGSAVRIDRILVVRANFDPGLLVKIQANGTNSWGSPTFTQIVVPVWHPEPYPYNLSVDVAAAIPVVATRTLRYVRVWAEGTNSVPISIGEIVVAKQEREDLQMLNGRLRNIDRLSKVLETEMGIIHAKDLGTTMRGYVADILMDDAADAALEYLFLDARGVALPFMLTPDPIATSESMLVSFRSTQRAHTRKENGVNVSTIEFVERSRGKYP